MVSKHGVPNSTELVRDDMADYEDKPKPKPVVKEVVRRPNTQSARYCHINYLHVYMCLAYIVIVYL